MKNIKKEFQILIQENKNVFINKIASNIKILSSSLPSEIETKIGILSDQLVDSILTSYQSYQQRKISTFEDKSSGEFILSVIAKIHNLGFGLQTENRIEVFRRIIGYYWKEYLNLIDQSWWGEKLKKELKLFLDYYFSRLEADYLQLRLENSDLYQAGGENQIESRLDNETEVGFQTDGRAEEKIEALYSVSRSLIESEDLADVLVKIADTVAETLEIDRTYIFIVDLEEQKITNMVSGGRHEVLENNKAQAEDINFQELWEGLSGWVLRNGKPAFSPKGQPDPRESLRVRKRRLETNSGDIVVVPLIYNEEVIGTMTGINQLDSENLRQEDLNLMSAMANQAAVAIENSRLFADQKAEKEKFKTLFQTANDLVLIHDVNGEILEANQVACEMLGYNKKKLMSINLQEIPGFDYNEKIKANLDLLFKEEELVFETSYYNYHRGVIYFEVNSKLIDYKDNKAIISLAREITDRKLKEEKLKRWANRDDLTGAYTRRVAERVLSQKMTDCCRSKERLTVSFVDIDDLKKINDNYGHQAGDKAIIKIIEMINDNIRETDLVARMGGDEFLVVFPDCSQTQAKRIWSRIVDSLEEFNNSSAVGYHLSISCGIIEYKGGEYSVKELIEEADNKMYKNKNSKSK